MTGNELRAFRGILEAKRAELVETLRRREGIRIEKSADELEETQNAADREIAILNLDRISNLLRDVQGALRRIEEGSFGACAQCEEEIGQRRLRAIPWTAFCIRCQEMADADQDGGIGAGTFLPTAA